jgi:flagellar biosynthesis/type III secretory pathway chaperone
MDNGQSAKAVIDELYDYLLSVKQIYTDIVPVLREEIDRISRDDVAALDETIKQQQALVFRTRSFDDRIAEYLKRLGSAAPTLIETVQGFPEDERFRFYDFLGEFDQVIEQVNFYRDKCRELLQSKLYSVDKQLAAIPHKWESTTYDNKAGEVTKSLHSKAFEKKI